MDPRITLLLESIDHAFGGSAWHGTTLTGSLRGLTVPTAIWRPRPKRHNIWELVLHAAYWKYIVRRRLTGVTGLRFSRSPSNWPSPSSDITPKALRLDIALLKEEHALLREAVAGFPASRLHRRAAESKWTYAQHIHGIAAHDLYHTGQIQLIKRLKRA